MRFIAVLMTLFVACTSAAVAAEYRIDFEEKVETTIPAGTVKAGKKVEADRTDVINDTVSVVLGPDYLWAITPTGKKFIDFAGKRMFTYDEKTKTYTNVSLFSDIAFRWAEFQNRQMLSELLSKSGIKNGVQSQTDIEHLFALQMPGTSLAAVKPVFDWSTVDGVEVFEKDGTEYVRFKPSSQAVPKELERAWMHALIYAFPMHPEIRKALLDSGRLPQEMTLVRPDQIERHVISLKFVDAKPVEAGLGKGPLEGYKPDTSKVFADVKPTPVAGIPKNRNDVVAFAKAAAARGDNVDALLSWFEWSIMTGEEPVQAIKEMKPKIDSDKHLRDLIGGFGEGEPNAQLQSLKRLDPLPLKKKYMLDVYKGNLLCQLDKGREGIALLKNAIRSNPKLAGAISDLADNYMAAYDTPAAFELWERAEAIAPNHKMLEREKKLKDHLQHSYPDFF